MKKWFFNVLNFLCFGKLSKCPLKIDEPPFQLLTPTDDADDFEPYRRAMDFALSPKRKNAKNIAVMGPYGAGKSSFLNTYFKERPDVLRVSLGLFLEKESIKEVDPGTLSFEHRLELGILQQIFCSRREPWRWLVIGVVTLLLLVGGALGICQPDCFVRRVSPSVHAFVVMWASWIFWLSVFDVVCVVSYLFVKLLLCIKEIGIKRVDVNGAGIGSLGFEVPDITKHSLLNRNVKAIIKFFASSRIDVVIFEDIDRFDDVRIFMKLREINILLNNSPSILAKNNPVRFIYAIREDLFPNATTRTKFFDYIIPIIPRINASNSRINMLEFFKECGDGKFDTKMERMVRAVAPYISDTRLIKNICNEYYTYRAQIVDCTSEEELLGLVIFKNFFPREFALMHQGKGMIMRLIAAKREAQRTQTARIDSRVQELQAEIRDVDNEKFAGVEALRMSYYVTLMKKFSENAPMVRIGGSRVNAAEIIHRKDWFEQLQKGGLRADGYGYGGSSFNWAEIEKDTDPNCSYAEHLVRIDGRLKGRVAQAQLEIRELRDQRKRIQRKSIVELLAEGLISEDAIRQSVLGKGVDEHDIALFCILIRRGYLNENYRYNISIFREVFGINSVEDYFFETGVASGGEPDWELALKRPEVIIENLDLECFSTPSILNFSICRELLKTPDGAKTKEFLQQIVVRERRNYEFVDAYLKTLQCKDDERDFFDCLLSVNENYISELVETSIEGEGLPRELVEKQVGLFIAWALRQGRVVAITGFAKTFMEETGRMPDLLKENGICTAEGMSAFVKMFGLRFKQLNCKAAKATGLLDVVIAERAYAIESDIIKGVLAGDGVDVAGFETKNYSVISKHKPVVACVDAEFKHYLDAVYLKCEAQQEDDLERVLDVINREDLSAEDKQKFIHHQWRKSRVDDVKKIKSDEMVRMCIKEDWIEPSWNNAIEVWNRNKDNQDPFREFVNREGCYKVLSARRTFPFAWDKNEGWVNVLVEDAALTDDAIAGLLSGMPEGVITSYTGANATPRRIQYLVEHNRVKYSNELYRSLKSIGNDSHIVLAVECAKEFCDEYEDRLVGEDDTKKILLSDRFVRRYAVRVINTLKDLIVDSGDLIDEVVRFINKGNYTEFDECVLDAALDSITPVSLQCRIIQHLGGDADEIRRQLGRLEEPYKKLAGLGCRQQISRWDGVESFLNFLKEKGVVSTTGDGDGGKIQVNTTRS